MTRGNWAKWRQSNALNPPGERIGPARRAQPIAWVCGGQAVGMGSFGRGVCFINLTVQLWKLSGSSHVSCHSVEIGCWSVGWGERWGVSGGGGGKRCWGVKGEQSGKGNHTGIYFKCIYKMKWGKKPSVFLLDHVREPLAKIIIYEGREREAKAFYYSGHRWSTLRQLED